ncbi:MAG: InlB B-repeat-containing protein [Gaiellaceae bacterium]
MRPAPRVVAAALIGAATAGLLLAGLASGAGRHAAASVTLQVAPRGPGTVAVSPVGGGFDSNPCDQNEGDSSCTWTYDRGATVKLTAAVAAGGKGFSGWSTPDCPGTGPCTVTLDQDATTVVATFDPLTLGVRLSGDGEGRVTSDPAGIDCSSEADAKCKATFPPHTQVTLTATPTSPNTFRAFEGCRTTNATTCTITVDDQTTWVGVAWNKEELPQLATTIKVQLRVGKSGNGSGRVTAPNVDCGSACSAQFDFGKSVTVTATPDQGSTFGGWNGVCPKTQASCTFAAGPITSIKAVFARDATPPTTPGGLKVTGVTRTSISIAWTASTDNVGVAGYRVYLNDSPAGDVTQTAFALAGLACGRTYAVAVDAADAVGNRSPKATLQARTKACALAARLAGAAVKRTGGVRVVTAQLRVNRETTARLALTAAGGKVVASGAYRVRPGTNALHLTVPGRVPRGSYLLRITLLDPDGGPARSFSRGILLPAPR